ncbi:MAG: 3-methyl-2-oxobutanoate hydroxymethyltransferase [Planctomycetota bacterium]
MSIHESMQPGADGPAGHPTRDPVTLRTLEQMAGLGEPFACLAAYDFTTARWLERGGVHVLLAGDSAANVVLGFDSTVHAPLEFLVTITAAIKRGAPKTLVMADMPFLSYHRSESQALRNAGKFMTRGTADCVKVEADASFAPVVRAMTRAGIPVCAHVGSRPQTAAVTSGPKAAGRTRSELQAIVDDAKALEDAGAVLLLIEAVPEEVSAAVLEATTRPVIGIGAGQACHGQILVVNDLLGLTDRPPRFADPVDDLGERIRAAGAEWVRRVGAREIGGKGYRMKAGEGPPRLSARA